jgi:hypothetical protein
MGEELRLEPWPSSLQNCKCLHPLLKFGRSLHPLTRSGYTVITTCSANNFEYVKSLGTDFAFDYHEQDVGLQIRETTNNKLRYAWDTVSVQRSAEICAEALTASFQLRPIYGTLLPIDSPRDDVETISTVMYTVFGKYFEFGSVQMAASQDDFRFGVEFFGLTEKLLEQVSFVRISLLTTRVADQEGTS